MGWGPKKMHAEEPRYEAAAIAIEHQAWVRQHGTWPGRPIRSKVKKRGKEVLTAT